MSKNVQGTESQARPPYSKTSPIVTEWPTATFSSKLDEKVDQRWTRGMSQSGCWKFSYDPQSFKKKGACDAAAQVVSYRSKDKRDNVADTR